MQGIRITRIIIILFLFTKGAAAQQVITLEEAVGAALNSNFDILLVKNDVDAAGVDRFYAFGNFVPAVNATAGLTQTISAQEQEFDTRPKSAGSGIRTVNINGAINLNWTVFDGFRMFAVKDRLNQQYDLANINLKNQVINTTAEVINAYYIIVRQKQRLKAIEEQMSINEERVKLADRKLSVGLGTKPELLQAKVDLNAQKAAHLQHRTVMTQSKDQLNQLTGMKLPAIYDVLDSIPINASLNIEDMLAGIENTNLTILQSLKTLDISETMLREAKGALWPSVSLVTAYNFTRNNNYNNINPYAPLYNMNRGLNFGVTATVPILNFMNVRRSIRQAQIDIHYNNINVTKQKNVINVAVKVGYYDYQYQLSALQLEEENIELAKENVYIAMERFKLGASTFLELREAQKSLEDAYDRLIAARYNTKVAETELLRLKGELVR